jgi:GTP-binding protein YchF
MKLGIIGTPQSGKTTIFNAAAGASESVGDFSQAVHRAVIKVPDNRLTQLAELVNPKKITCAEIEFLDAPGFSGEGKKSGALEIHPDIRKMDAFMLVVNAFSSDAGPEGAIQNLIDEMILLDQAMLESNIDKKARKMNLTADKSEARELEILKHCLTQVEKEKPLLELGLPEEELRAIRGYMFLSLKPLLLVVNISEEDLPRSAEIAQRYARFVSPGKRDVVIVCGKIEAELMALEGGERQQFLQELGISHPATELVVQKSYDLLGLISFLTAGEPEVRAWTIRKGTNAQQAAGVIHSDIERGFIRAEVIKFNDYVQHKTHAALKAAGKLRLEGKEYIVADGDVMLFRFNV